MPHAGEHHGDLQPVRGFDHLRVAHRPARLDHRRGAVPGRFFQPSLRFSYSGLSTAKLCGRVTAFDLSYHLSLVDAVTFVDI